MYSLNDKIDIAGDWWKGEDPKTTISGQLTFSRDNGIELRVNQAFHPPHGAVRPGDPNPRYECIHGVTVKGEAVTLIDAQQIGTALNFGTGGLRQPGRIHARILVIGAHLPPQFRFPKIYFRVPGLQVWLAQQVIAHNARFDSESKFRREDYSLGPFAEEAFEVPAIASTISMHYGWNSNTDNYSLVQISVAAWFGVKPATRQLVDWFLEQDDKLLALVSLLAGQVMASDAIQAQVDDSNRRVSVLFASKEAERPKQKRPSDYFLSRTAISIPFSDCCKKWFDVVPKVEKPVALTMSVMASDDLWLHMEFLSLVQALEGFHRSLYGGKYMEDEAYEPLRQELLNAIPASVNSDHRAALRSRVRYGNQYSLRKRLGELEAFLTDEIRKYIFGQTKSIPQTWVDTRNYYTHWDEELRSNILENQEMYFANVRLAHFLSTLFRLLVGVPTADIEAAFLGSSNAAQDLVQINIISRRAADPSFVPNAIMTVSSGDNNHDDETSSSSAEEEDDPNNGIK
jgi:hypothetical protein